MTLAEVVYRADQDPALLCIGRPAMVRGIVLNQCADRGGDDLAVVNLLFWVGKVGAHALGGIDDGRQGGRKSSLADPIPNGRVIVAGDREALVIDQAFLHRQLLANLLLNIRIEPMVALAMIVNRKGIRVTPVLLHQAEESRPANAQSLLHGRPVQFAFNILSQQDPHLLAAKPPVHLLHTYLLPEGCIARSSPLFKLKQSTFEP